MNALRQPPASPPVRNVANTGHASRVTLNLIRLSSVCPPDLRVALDDLDAVGWRTEDLEPGQVELIYAEVSDPLAQQALAEFDADTTSLIDNRKCDAECRLCGQQHIRFEFLLRNRSGGRDVWTGSDCIARHALSVDGEAASSHTLKKLIKAIRRAQRVADRDAWQEAHPNHAADFAAIDDLLTTIPSPDLRALPEWTRRWGMWAGKRSALRQRLVAVLRYYRREGFVTKLRTAQVYNPEIGLLNKTTALLIERNAWRTL